MLNLFREIYITLNENVECGNEYSVSDLTPEFVANLGGYVSTFIYMKSTDKVIYKVTTEGFFSILNIYLCELFPKLTKVDHYELLRLMFLSETGGFVENPGVYIDKSDLGSLSCSEEFPINPEDLPFEIMFIRYLARPTAYRKIIEKHLEKLKRHTAIVLQNELIEKLLKRNVRLGHATLGRSYTTTEYFSLPGRYSEFGWMSERGSGNPGAKFYETLDPENVYKLVALHLIPSLTHYMAGKRYDPTLYFINVRETYTLLYPALCAKDNRILLERMVSANANILHSIDGTLNETFASILIKLYLDKSSIALGLLEQGKK